MHACKAPTTVPSTAVTRQHELTRDKKQCELSPGAWFLGHLFTVPLPKSLPSRPYEKQCTPKI